MCRKMINVCPTPKRNLCLIRKMLLILFLILQAGCHSPVFNQVDRSTRNVLTWIGTPIKKMVLVKGAPVEVYYLGSHEISLTTSEYWIPELDRFSSLYRPYGVPVNHQTSQKNFEKLYRQQNGEGVWLLVYQTALREHKKGLRDCTEFYLVNYQGLISNAGYIGSIIGDHRHCPLPMPVLLEDA